MSGNATKFFRGEERYNCAQAILKGFQEKYQVPQEIIDAFKSYGGGRAEGGLCGALFAAKHLLKNKNVSQEIEKRFQEITGGTHCKVIRKLNRVPCAGCVKAAEELLNALENEEEATGTSQA